MASLPRYKDEAASAAERSPVQVDGGYGSRLGDESDEELLEQVEHITKNNDTRPANPRRSTSSSSTARLFSSSRFSLRAALLGSGVLAVLLLLAAGASGYSPRATDQLRSKMGVGRFEYRPALDSNKRAVMIEKRNHKNLVPLLHDFLVKVPAEWPFQVWCGSENEPVLRKSRLLAPYIESGKLNLTLLPDEDAIYNGYTLSKFLTVPWFWEQLAPAEHIFFFQLDSVICGQSDKTLNDFLGTDVVPGGYSWLGAVWFQYGYPAKPFWGGNGGFSLRRRSAMLNITQTHEWDESNEDMWFAKHIQESNGAWPISTQNVAMHFAHETIPEEARKFNWAFKPYGMHTGSVWMTCYYERWDDIKRLLNYCPELAMIAPHHCLPEM